MINHATDRDSALSPELQLQELEIAHDSPPLAIARVLWQKRLRLAKAALIGLLLAALVTLAIPNTYEASVQLMPPDTSSGSGMSAFVAMMAKGGLGAGSGLIGDLLGEKNTGVLFMGIMRSRTVEDRIIDRFDLRKVYWRKKYVDAREQLASRTSLKEDRKAGIITVSVSDHDRDRASAMAQAYVDELDRLLAQVTTSSAHRERVFLEQRLAVVHDELRKASQDLSEFSSKNATLDLKDQGKAMVEATAVLQGQLVAAESELSGLQQIYTAENVRVRALEARIAELRRQLDKLGGKDYAGATTLSPGSLYPSLRQLPVLGLRYAELFRQVKITETVFEILTEQYELAKVQEAKEIPSVKVLDPAELPERKSWPPRLWLSIFGSLLGVVLASAWIVGSQFWSEIDPNEPHKAFLSEVWAETRPLIRKPVAELRSRLSPHRNGRGDAPPEQRNA